MCRNPDAYSLRPFCTQIEPIETLLLFKNKSRLLDRQKAPTSFVLPLFIIAPKAAQMSMAALTVNLISCAERWLMAGTGYAMPEMLPMPREWYKKWEQGTRNGSGRGLTDANVDEVESAVPPLASTACIFNA